MYHRLDPDHLTTTLDQLRARINDRFPDASLGHVCGELSQMARAAKARVESIEKPRLGLRVLIGIVIIAGLSGLLAIAVFVSRYKANTEALSMIQGIDAGFNILVLTGGALYYLVSLEQRSKRRKALADLHRLRSIVHVIDMHQLTKDPSAALSGGAPTAHSPKRVMSNFELMRYLDYCSEMLSLTAKLAALYAQSSRDTAVIGTVNELEQLAANLSQKIWQKIMVVEMAEGRRGKGVVQVERSE